MSKSVISRGTTLDEAIHSGIQLLQTSISSVNIDIIQENRKVLFGLRKKQAVVKVTLQEAQTINKDKMLVFIEDILHQEENIIKNNSDEKLLGKAWIEHGNVFVEESPTHFPVLIPSDNISLFKNGIRYTESLIVTAKDHIHIEVKDEKVLPAWSISIDSTNMEARIHVKPGFETIYQVMDTTPSNKTKIYAQVIEKNLISISINEILNRINELGIRFGIDYEEIRRSSETNCEASFIIAQGKLPKAGKNGDLKYIVDMNERIKKPKERSDGTMDFRDIFHVPSVSPGQVITEYIPSTPGESGIDIFGVERPARHGQDLTFLTQNGVILLEPENKLVAKDYGRPQIEVNGTLVKATIMRKLTVRQDVDIKKGNINFIGDVELLKNVNEKMVVKADGNIVLHGSANFATLTASNSIVIKKNVINCEITAGKGNVCTSELNEMLGEIYIHLNNLIQAVKQINAANTIKTSDLSSIGSGFLIKLLLEQKFNVLIPLLKNFVKKVFESGELMNEEWHLLAKKFHKGFLILSIDEVQSIQELIRFTDDIKLLQRTCPSPFDSDSTISIGYALNSNIYSSGDIQITETGCYNCKISSEGSIKVKGIVRGSYLFAKKGISLNESGSEGGSRTVIHVPSNQSIYIQKANEGTLVRIGNKSHLFTTDYFGVNISLDQNNQIQIM